MYYELSIDLILASLPDSVAHIVLNYRMNNNMSTMPKLINLFKTTESSLRKKGKACDAYGFF